MTSEPHDALQVLVAQLVDDFRLPKPREKTLQRRGISSLGVEACFSISDAPPQSQASMGKANSKTGKDPR